MNLNEVGATFKDSSVCNCWSLKSKNVVSIVDGIDI